MSTSVEGSYQGPETPTLAEVAPKSRSRRGQPMCWFLRRRFRVAAWNLLALGDFDRLSVLSRELEILGVDIMALLEVKRLGSGLALMEAYSYYY